MSNGKKRPVKKPPMEWAQMRMNDEGFRAWAVQVMFQAQSAHRVSR